MVQKLSSIGITGQTMKEKGEAEVIKKAGEKN